MSSALIARLVPRDPLPPPPLYRRMDLWLTAFSIVPVIALGSLTWDSPAQIIAAVLSAVAVILCFVSALRWRRADLHRRHRAPLVQALFCADDSEVERTLPYYWKTDEQLDALFGLGNLQSLGAGTNHGTIAFTRDRDEPWTLNQPQTYSAGLFRSHPPLIGQARVWFLHDGFHWLIKDGRNSVDSWEARRVPWRLL